MKIYKLNGRMYTEKELYNEYLKDDGGAYNFAEYVDWLQEDGLQVMTAFEAATDLLQNSQTFRIADYRSYVAGKSSDGGGYADGVIYKVFEKNWGVRPWTTGDFCPDCRSFSCSGCWEWRPVTRTTAAKQVIDMLKDHSIEAVQWL